MRSTETMSRKTIRGLAGGWLAIMAVLAVIGCSSQPDVATETVTGPVAARTDTTTEPLPPPVVPVGLDTSFVLAADEAFGTVMDRETVTELEAETVVLQAQVTVIDTLGAVARFLQGAATPGDRYAMSAADSQVVGRLLLQGMAEDDREAQAVLDLSDALQNLETYLNEADDLNTELGWDGQDPARLAQSREIKVAVLGFGQSSQSLRDDLEKLHHELGPTTQTADSARTQQEISQLVRGFGADLDKIINQMGRAAQSISAGSLSPESLDGFRTNLLQNKDTLLEFEARWDQFEQTGSLDLANPEDAYNSGRMRGLLQRMEKDLDYLASLAWQRGKALSEAADFQGELEARRKAEEFVQKTQQTLMELKERNRTLIGAYGRLASRYWKGRLDQVAADKAERERLYAQLTEMAERAGGVGRIRADADLLATYRSISDQLVARRRAHLDRVAAHDRMRENVRAALAADLYNRARVLGEPEDYEEALATYEQLTEEQPGQYPWLYQMASLAWSRSQETWAWPDDVAPGATIGARSRAQAAQWLDRCEDVLLQRHRFDQDMDETQAMLQPGRTEATTVAMAGDPTVRAALIEPADGRWYYRRFVAKARQDLQALGDDVRDPEVRQWLLNIDILRKRLLFDADDGDGFLYRYARQVMLSDEVDTDGAREVLEHWSWDDGNLALRRRWAETSLLPDSTATQAEAKNDSLVALLATVRTAGTRRQITWAIGNNEFLKLEAYDQGLERMHGLLQDVTAQPTLQPEAGAIDSTVTAVYPVFLYNRGTFYQQEGQRQEAFYCFLGVAERYAQDLRTAAVARYSAASLLADGNKRGALQLVREAITDAMHVIGRNPADFDLETLVAMYELRQTLAGDLGLFQEAIKARDEARQLKGLADHASVMTGGGS